MRLLALLLALLWCEYSVADPLTPFNGQSQEVTVQDVLPHYEANRDNGSYSEWWSFVFRLDGGYWAYVQFLITNVGVDKGKAAVKAEVKFPDGERFSEKTEYGPGQWTSARDRFEVKFGDNTLSGPLDGVRIRVKNPSFEAEYQLKNLVPPWKPGNGVAQYGASSSRYYQFQAFAPVAAVEGTVKVADSDEVHKVKGLVYGEHQLQSIGMHEQAKRWARFRALGEKTTFLMGSIQTPDVYGNKPVRFAVLFVDGKKVFESTSFEVKEADYYEDQKKAGYAAPRLLELTGDSEAGKFRAVIKATKLTDREDFLESSGAAVRFVVSKFAKPIMYYFDGQFAVELAQPDGKTVRSGGKGTYYFTVVNP